MSSNETNPRKRRLADSEKAHESRRRRRELRRMRSTEYPKSEGSSSASGELAYGHVSVMGRMRVMEDAVTVAPPEKLAGEYSFFAVYDGHGGAEVAEKCSRRMHRCLEMHLEKWREETAGDGGDEEQDIDWERVMRECFRSVDEEVAPDHRTTGSTAVVVLVGKEDMVVANCGDSRAVLCRAGIPVPLSTDHKADRPDEIERVEAAGGLVLNWNGCRVQGILSTSRSLGDEYLKPYVTSEPEVRVVRRSETDDFLITASDGLWDVVSNELACETVRKCLSGRLRRRQQSTDSAIGPSDTAATLAELAMSKGSRDNISISIVKLK